MLKPTVKRGLMLDFAPKTIINVQNCFKERVFKLNNKKICDGFICYIMSRELRVDDNWALIFAKELATMHNLELKIVVYLDKTQYSKAQESFLFEGLKHLKQNLEQNNINYEISNKIPADSAALIFDFNPINVIYNYIKDANCACFEVDSHNIIPARFVSDKQEFSAATIRRKVYSNIAHFLTEFPSPNTKNKIFGKEQLDSFINNKLFSYSELKNNPLVDSTSGLSPYLHFGFVSAQRVALEVLKSSASRANKEAYLEELIVRKELSDNFCLYSKNYKTFESVLPWAKDSLDEHRNDIRTYIYSKSEFKNGKTHDRLWNKIQIGLLKNGKIHGYLRMYWAKKILEWTKSPEDALDIAIYLNDEYALDGHDPNGYVGVLWSIAGLHDRPFANRLVTGKIRYMGISACNRNFDVNKYVNED